MARALCHPLGHAGTKSHGYSVGGWRTNRYLLPVIEDSGNGGDWVKSNLEGT